MRSSSSGLGSSRTSASRTTRASAPPAPTSSARRRVESVSSARRTRAANYTPRSAGSLTGSYEAWRVLGTAGPVDGSTVGCEFAKTPLDGQRKLLALAFELGADLAQRAEHRLDRRR